MRIKIVAILLVLSFVPLAHTQTDHPFNPMETSIEQIHQAIEAGTLTCHALELDK